ncbi:MAG: hypothetical protein E7041_02505 [Lentisphaerae bacterium]|nr:hypothetical protein [Lentisphaerota bacterium]MBQ9803401.1 hypothetical protein [Lentisphaeria bacterium]
MDENKSVISGEFDRSGRYDAGLKSLAKSLQLAFLFLLIGIIGTLIYFFSGAGYFSVEPQQAVIVTRFGKIIGTYTSGGHWFLPYPVNQFIRVQTSQQLLEIELAPAANAAGGDGSLEPGRDNYLLTGDANIVHSSWTIAYRVSNPEKYYETLLTPQMPVENGKVTPDDVFTDADGMKSTRGPVTFLQNLFRQAVINVTASSEVGDILYAGQGKFSEAVRREYSRLVTAGDCGVVIESVGLNRIYPPEKTKAAFDEVTAAGNTRSTLRNEAIAYQVGVENETSSEKASIIAAADTYKKRVIARTEAQRAYFDKIYAQYKLNPETVTMALYTAMLNDVSAKIQNDKFLLGTMGTKKQLRMLLNPELKKSVKKDPAAGEGK